MASKRPSGLQPRVLYSGWWRSGRGRKKVRVMVSFDKEFLRSLAHAKFEQLLRENGLGPSSSKGACLTVEAPGGIILKRVSWRSP